MSSLRRPESKEGGNNRLAMLELEDEFGTARNGDRVEIGRAEVANVIIGMFVKLGSRSC